MVRRSLVIALVGAIAFAVGVLPDPSRVAPAPRVTTAPPDFPLAKYLGFGHNPAADDAYFAKQEIEFENVIAKCMEAKGFEYSPERTVEIDEDDATTRDQMLALARSNPNTVYRASLSNDERRAYDLALAGVPDANSESAYGGGGCLGIADRRVPSVFLAASTLEGPFEKLHQRIADDPRVLDAEIRWSECMEGFGFDFSTIQAMHASVTKAMAQGLSTAEVEVANSIYEEALKISPICLTSVDYQRAWDAAQIEHEQTFVDVHQEILDRLGVRVTRGR